jgi:hypothetical protein
MDHTFGEETCRAETYHIGVTRKQLTKNIETLFPEVFDELKTSFNDHLPQTEGSFSSDIRARERQPLTIELQIGSATLQWIPSYTSFAG